MELRESGIYKITYRGKMYIGQSINVEKRMTEHLRQLKNGSHYNVHLQNVFNKYGEDDFKIEVIEYCDCGILDDREKYWISFYDSFKYGYNQTSGGSGLGYNSKVYKYTYIKNSSKTKKVHKFVNLSTGQYFDSAKDVVSFYNVKSSQHLYKTCKEPGHKFMDCFWCYDYYGIDIEKELGIAEKLYSDHKSRLLTREVKIINVTTGEVFDSINKAARHYKINATYISKCINSKQKATHDYIFMKLDDYQNNNILNTCTKHTIQNTDRTPKPVINVSTKIIYPSINQATKENGILSSNISECCMHQRVFAGGFQWEYYTDDMDIDNIPTRDKNENRSAKKIINIDTGVIYKSASQAAKSLSLHYQAVLNVCKGKLKTTGGYRFEFYQEEL